MKKKLKILVVEDDIFLAEELKRHINEFITSCYAQLDISITYTHSAVDCCERLERDIDIVCMDYYLEDEFGEVIFPGEYLIKAINQYCNDCKVVVVSIKQIELTASNLIKKGVYDFIQKDNDIFLRLNMTLHHIINNKLQTAAA